MKNSKTTLMELTREYRNILKKCFLLNLGVVLFSGAAHALTVDAGNPLNIIDPQDPEIIYDDQGLTVTNTGRVRLTNVDVGFHGDISFQNGSQTYMTNAGIYTEEDELYNYNFNIAGGRFVMDNSELGGHSIFNITGGNFVLSHDSELAGASELNITDAQVSLDSSYLLSRTDGATKGRIVITDSDITVNKGFIGAFNYSDSPTHISEGGIINIAGTSTITFNGGNAMDEPQDWEDIPGDPAEGRFLANEILANQINLSQDAKMTVAAGATLKTIKATYTGGPQSGEININEDAAVINMVDNAQLDVNGALRASISTEYSGNTSISITAQNPESESYIWADTAILLGESTVNLSALGRDSFAELKVNGNMTINGNSTWNLDSTGRDSEVEANIYGNVILGSDKTWIINAPSRFNGSDADFHIAGNFTISARSSLIVNHPMTEDDYEGVEFHANLVVADDATIKLTGSELEGRTTTIRTSDVVVNDGGIFGEGYRDNFPTSLTIQNSNVDLTYGDLAVERSGENFYDLMDNQDQREFLDEMREDIDEGRNLAYNILNNLQIADMPLSEDITLHLDQEHDELVWTDGTGPHNYSWDEGAEKIQTYLESVYDNVNELKKINDYMASVNRQATGSVSLYGTTITAQYASEITNELSGTLYISNSDITLNKGKAHTSVLSHQGTTGDIYVTDSAVTLNDNTSIIRGLYRWAEKAFVVNPGVETSHGDIVFNNSTLDMNGTSFVAMSDTDGNFALTDNSILNVNGKNTIYLRNKADEENAASVYVGGTAALNVAKGATLTLVTGTSPYSIIYGDTNSQINIAGTLKGDVSSLGLLTLTNGGKINGHVYQATNLVLDGLKGDVKSILGSTLQDNKTLTLSGAGKYTLNNAMFSVSDEDDTIYVYWDRDEGSKYKSVYGTVDWTAYDPETIQETKDGICAKNGNDYDCFAPIDNQLTTIEVLDKTSLTTGKTLYAETVGLNNQATLSLNNTFKIDDLYLNNGSKATFSKGTGDLGSLWATNNSKLEFSSGIDYYISSGTILNSELATNKNELFEIDDLSLTDSKWTDNSSLIEGFGNFDILDVSNITLNNSKAFIENLNIVGNGSIQRLQATLNKGTILGGHTFDLSNTNLVANNATLGVQLIGVETYLDKETDVPYDHNASAELFDIENSVITLNGNSSLKNTLWYRIEGKNTYTELTPEYLANNTNAVNLSTALTESGNGGALARMDDFASNIYIGNSNITLNGSASIENNSITVGDGSKGNIEIYDNSELRIQGKNTITATGDINLYDSTLSIAPGAVLKVRNGWYNGEYTDNTIYLSRQAEPANLELSGKLDGSLSGYVKNLTVSSNFDWTGDINLSGTITGFGVSGASNAKALSKIQEKFDNMTNGVSMSLDTFSMVDKSNLSASLIYDDYLDEIAGSGTLNIKYNSTFTMDNLDPFDANTDLEIGYVNVYNAALKLTKDASMHVDTMLTLENSSLTLTGDVNKGGSSTWLETKNILMDNTGKPRTELSVTNAKVSATNMIIDLYDTNVKLVGNYKNGSNVTTLKSKGAINIENTPNTKATVNVSGANMEAEGNFIRMINTSLTFNGDAQRYKTGSANYISVGAEDGSLIIKNSDNAKAAVSISNAQIEADNVQIQDTSSVKLSNLWVFGGFSSDATWAISNSKNVNLSNVYADYADIDMTNIENVTINNNSSIADLSIDTSKKATLANLNVVGAKFKDIQTLNISNVVFDVDEDADEDGVEIVGNMTTVQNKGTKKEKVVYASNATINGSTTITGDLSVDNAMVTINKGVDILGNLIVKENDSHDTAHTDASEKINATRVVVKDNLSVDGEVSLTQGTIEVAAKKTLAAGSGFALGQYSSLLLNGVAEGAIVGSGTISILNNAARIYGNTNLSSGTLEFKKVKGNLSTFIEDNNVLGLGDLKLKDTTLTIDRNNTGLGNDSLAIDNDLTVDNSTLTLNRDVDVSGDFTMAKGNLYLKTNTLDITGDANIHDKSTIYIDVDESGHYGSLKADTINLETYTTGKNIGKPTNITLAVTLPRAKVDNSSIYNKLYKFLDYETSGKHITGNLNKVTIANNRYNFEETAVGQFYVTQSTNGKGVITRYTGKVAPGILNAVTALVDSTLSFKLANQEALANNLDALSQVVGGEGDYIQALSATNPDDGAIVQTSALIATDTLLDTAAARMTGGLAAGVSAGDVSGNHGAMWGQALYNQTKLDDTHKYQGFKGISKGTALGVEANVTDDVKLGVAYAYTKNDIKSRYRKMDVDTHGVSLYGEYKPNNWFVNAITAFSWSDYDTKAWSALGTKKEDFDVHTYSAQATTGYVFDLTDHIQTTPSVGLRYVSLNQESYKDSDDKKIKSTHNDLATVLVGNSFKASYATENGVKWNPELRIGLSYDVHTDADDLVVGLSNGTSYHVPTRRLKRLGITGGVDWDLSLGYDVDVRKEYRSHTGSLKAKYHF